MLFDTVSLPGAPRVDKAVDFDVDLLGRIDDLGVTLDGGCIGDDTAGDDNVGDVSTITEGGGGMTTGIGGY